MRQSAFARRVVGGSLSRRRNGVCDYRRQQGRTFAGQINCRGQLLVYGQFAGVSDFSHFDSLKHNRLTRADTVPRATTRSPVLDLTTVCLE